jgi:hypothetical protein
MWLIRNHPEIIGKKVTIYTNNQVIISAIRDVKKLSGQYLIQAIYNSINSLECDIKVVWISGHSDVHGNEAVNKLAKEAADRHVSRRDQLPPMLRKALPTSLLEIKQEYHRKLIKKWEKFWLQFPQKHQLDQLWLPI